MKEQHKAAMAARATKVASGVKRIAALALALAFVVTMASAHEALGTDRAKTLIPIGKTIGVKLFSDGVMVVGVSEVSSGGSETSPAKDCGLAPGDIITHINSSEIESSEQLASIVNDSDGEELSVRAMRDGTAVEFEITPALSDDGYRLGAWIRDSIAGIGTMTFYDPDTGAFGALGHGVNDVDTSRLVPLGSGSIMYSSINSVKKGKSGTPGELRGNFDVQTSMGTIYKNTDFGIFGQADSELYEDYGDPIPIALAQEVQNGTASILSNISGDEIEEFQIEIVKQFPSRSETSRNMMIRVTDEKLLAATGGIVQGMSGSPIIQNGKIIGAVTHVLIGDPTRGYGVYIENMLNQATFENEEND